MHWVLLYRGYWAPTTALRANATKDEPCVSLPFAPHRYIPYAGQHHSARPVGAARLLLSVGDSIGASTEEDLRSAPRTRVQLKDIFAPRRAQHDSYCSDSNVRPGAEGFGGRAVPLHRLDRLQEVANLALEDRDGAAGAWGCADIGAGA